MAFIDSATLKATYSDFDCVPDATVELWLTQAERIVGDDWCGDQAHDLATLAAHYLTINGFGETGAAMKKREDKGVKSVRSKSLQITYMDASSDGGGGEAFYSQTRYGRQFWPILRACRGGPCVTDTGCLPHGSW